MTSYRFRQRIDNNAYRLPLSANQELGHLPGPRTGWLEQHIFRFLKDDQNYIAGLAAEFGELFTVPYLFGKRVVFMVGADANKAVLGNASKAFSNYRAYSAIKVFAGDSIVTRDFQDHTELRKLVAPSFAGSAMPKYLEQINTCCEKHLNQFTAQNNQVAFYRFAKTLTLDIAANVFAGINLGQEQTKMNQALKAVLNVVNAKLPIPLPGTTLYQGLRGRSYSEKYFRSCIPSRRNSKRNDLFSRLCTAENDAGERLSDQDIIDNVIGALIAGHDTSTIAITALAYELSKSPPRQKYLANLCQEVYTQTACEYLPYSHLKQLEVLDGYIKEVLRMYTPIRYIQRRLVKDFEFNGQRIPANTNVVLAIHHTHQSPAYFEDPQRFQPERFNNDSRDSKIDSYAWAPFGKGAHLCIGMQFAMLEIKALVYRLLLGYEIELPKETELVMSGVPVAKPIGEVQLVLKPRHH